MSITLNLLKISIFITISFVAIKNVNGQTGTPSITQSILSDGTLNTSVSCIGNICDITGGKIDITNRNLFHSFSNFSVPTGGEVYFLHQGNIQNIISRVTGTHISSIDGKISSSCPTNMFLINPNGVVISQNASLNTIGQFTAIQTDKVKFENQGFFGVNTGNDVSLLTVNPSAFLVNQISDNTLNTAVSCNINGCDITGGKTDMTGLNLFHSFSDFSVPISDKVYFKNPDNVQNIISRVTGTKISNLEGTIRSNGATNMFLINPNGVVISNNASLNIKGTFTFEKADTIQFGNHGFFGVNTGNNVSLLTFNPTAFLSNQIIVSKIQVDDDITKNDNSESVLPESWVKNSQKLSNIALINEGCYRKKGPKFNVNNTVGIKPNVPRAIDNEDLPLLVAQNTENTLVEATGWNVNEKGQVVLISQQRNIPNDNFMLSSCNNNSQHFSQ